jgi:hypothetical protein
MRNVKLNLSEDKRVLTVTIDMTDEGQPSKSGLSRNIASTHGNVSIESLGVPGAHLGINLYRLLPKSLVSED